MKGLGLKAGTCLALMTVDKVSSKALTARIRLGLVDEPLRDGPNEVLDIELALWMDGDDLRLTSVWIRLYLKGFQSEALWCGGVHGGTMARLVETATRSRLSMAAPSPGSKLGRIPA